MGALKGTSEIARRSAFRIPRLALWAGVGIFVLIIAVVNCDNDEESAKPTEEGFVYVGTMEGEKNHVYKLNALTGEKVFGLGGQAKAELYIAVDVGNGDVFIYCTSSLSRYSKSGPYWRL